MKTILLSLLVLGAASCSAQRNITPKATKQVSCNAERPEMKNVRLRSQNRVTSGVDTAMCSGWKLNPAQITAIIQSGKTISSETLHGQFDFLSCSYRGEVEINGCRYEFAVNAGSWFSLTKDEKTGYFGCYEKQVAKFFLSAPEK